MDKLKKGIVFQLQVFHLRIIILLIFVLFISPAYSQNLVPNPSFEELDCRPYWRDNFFCSKDGEPAGRTPDLFHITSIQSTLIESSHIPDNGLGYQYARTGNAYAGLFNYTNDLWIESIIVPLAEPMKVGQEYSVGMYVSLGDNSKYASNCQGVLFLEDVYDIPYPEPQLFNMSVITDVDSWTLISHTFVSDRPYKYMILSNYCPPPDPRFQMTQIQPYGYASFYYIDDVFVTPTSNTIDITHHYIDNCFPVTIEFEALNISPSNYWEWDFGGGNKIVSQKPVYTFNTPGKYSVNLTTIENGRTYTISKEIVVTGFYNPSVNFEVPGEKEMSSPVYFQNNSSNASSYIWNFGDGKTSTEYSPAHTYSEPGFYNVKLLAFNSEGCSDSITKSIYIRCDTRIIANLFTPNGDGKNDVFDFSKLSICEDVKIEVYNRWGTLVYESIDANVPWEA